MGIVRTAWVYRNPHPAYRSVVAAAATASWGAVATSNPRLVCAFRTGQAKMSPDGVVVLRGSGDGGAAWEPVPSPFGPDPEPGISLAGVHLGADPAGTLVLAAARMRVVAPEDPAWDDQATGIVDAATALRTALAPVSQRSASTPWTPQSRYAPPSLGSASQLSGERIRIIRTSPMTPPRR